MCCVEVWGWAWEIEGGEDGVDAFGASDGVELPGRGEWPRGEDLRRIEGR